MWAANMARPDSLNAVREVARHSHNPSNDRWRAVVQIPRYLKGTSGPGLTFRKGAGTDSVTFTGEDFAKNKKNRRSVSGSATMYLRTRVAAYISRTQPCVSLSSTEVEYIAMEEGIKMLQFARQILEFLRPGRRQRCVTVLEDNEGAIN